MSAKRPQDWTDEEKLAAAIEAAAVSDADLGGFLRRKGLHGAQLNEWRRQVAGKPSQAACPHLQALRGGPPGQGELEKELHRKDKALADTAALLLQKRTGCFTSAHGVPWPPVTHRFCDQTQKVIQRRFRLVNQLLTAHARACRPRILLMASTDSGDLLKTGRHGVGTGGLHPLESVVDLGRYMRELLKPKGFRQCRLRVISN